jgi:DNA processing protein
MPPVRLFLLTGRFFIFESNSPIMNEDKLVAILALQAAPGVGDRTAKKLIAYCGSPQAVFTTSKRDLTRVDGIGSFVAQALSNNTLFKQAESELSFIRKNNIQCHYFEDASYPFALKHCVDGPILMFSSGNIAINDQPILSIVGTRRATPRGISFCEELIAQLAPFNPIIVSGFAYGIDIVAHRAAIANNLQTVGCLAHGIQKCYPASHRKYRSNIENNGGFYSDFWSNAPFAKSNFLKRNRIIAGLSSATLVIESDQKGGSLITANMAFDYNRVVMAVPGRPSDTMSKGCNDLIKAQKAYVLTSAEDVMLQLNWQQKPTQTPVQKKLFVELTDQERTVLQVLQETGKEQLDFIAIKSNYPISQTASLLFALEMKGVVKPLPGKWYKMI